MCFKVEIKFLLKTNFCSFIVTSTTGLPTVPPTDIAESNTTIIIATSLSVIILVFIIVTSVLVIIMLYSRIHKTSGVL